MKKIQEEVHRLQECAEQKNRQLLASVSTEQQVYCILCTSFLLLLVLLLSFVRISEHRLQMCYIWH